MKNYIIGSLVVMSVLLASIIYKNGRLSIYRFPDLKDNSKVNVEVPLFLHIFFSKKNCVDCMEIIEVLNSLPPQFIVSGIVPEEELKDEEELRSITGAAFPLISPKSKKYIPWYTPTIIGVSPKGDMIFVLPGVPGGESYLKNFLESLYGKLYPVFLKEKFSKNNI